MVGPNSYFTPDWTLSRESSPTLTPDPTLGPDIMSVSIVLYAPSPRYMASTRQLALSGINLPVWKQGSWEQERDEERY